MVDMKSHSSDVIVSPPLGAGDVAPCVPIQASEIQIEGRLVRPHMWFDVRRYSWVRHGESFPVPSGQFSYLGLRLNQRRSDTLIALPTPTGAHNFARPGEIMYVPAGEQIQARAAPSSERLACFMFKPDVGATLLHEDWSSVEFDASLDVRNPAIRASLLRLAEEVQSPGFASDVFVDSYAASIIVELARHYRSNRAQPSEKQGTLAPWQMRLVLQRVESASGDALTLTDIAADCRISVRHLSRAFKASTGMTLGTYIAEARLRRAKSMLSGHYVSIKNVAAACGFQSSAAFGSAFRRNTGLTPGQYRRQLDGRRLPETS